MTDYAAGLRQVIQDLVAPDLRTISARQESLQKQMETMQKQLLSERLAVVGKKT
jgi:capsule polysaccharide export protein KpsE/RkpR